MVDAIKTISNSYPVRYMVYDKNLDNFAEHVKVHASNDDLVLLLGAGRLNLVAPKVIEL